MPNYFSWILSTTSAPRAVDIYGRCDCGRGACAPNLRQCRECINEQFSEHAEEFRRAHAQGNL